MAAEVDAIASRDRQMPITILNRKKKKMTLITGD